MTAVGQMINLMSNDVSRFDSLFICLNYLWAGPLAMIITTLVLYYNVGISSLVGLVVMFFIIPLQSIFTLMG